MSNTNWVSDQLHSILGLSDATTQQYLISLARDSKSIANLQARIYDDGLLDQTSQVSEFITKLYCEFGPAQPTP